MTSVPMRVRLDPETDQALRNAARDREMPVATLAAQLVRSGVAGDTLPKPAAHPLVAATKEMLDWPADDDCQRVQMEAAGQYARMAAAGSVPAVDAWERSMRSLLMSLE
jgi:hypothetical protein